MLSQKHRDELRASGLSDETIAEARFYTETDPKKIQLILGWKTPASCLGPCLVMPFMNGNGEWDGFARVKPTFPRTSKKKNGELKKVKYEQPAGAGLRVYIPPAARSAVNTDGVMLAITEGEKKSLCATQSGVPTLALCGVEAWGKRLKDEKGNKTGPRRLIADLARINWLNRVVLIIFDTDSDHNPDVARAAAELARVLTELGAVVHIVELPLGPVGADGLPQKMGLDDFVVLYGRETLHELIEHQMSPPHLRDVRSYRDDLVAARLRLIGKPGVYLDTSPTGSGKSRADITVLFRVSTSLTVLPSHKQCEQAEFDMLLARLKAAAFVAADDESCCCFSELKAVMENGLSPAAAICPSCDFKDKCLYQFAAKGAMAADHCIATQSRADHTLESLADGRDMVLIHDSANCLRPVYEARGGFDSIIAGADQARGAILLGDPCDEFFYARSAERRNEWFFHRYARTSFAADAFLGHRFAPIGEGSR